MKSQNNNNDNTNITVDNISNNLQSIINEQLKLLEIDSKNPAFIAYIAAYMVNDDIIDNDIPGNEGTSNFIKSIDLLANLRDLDKVQDFFEKVYKKVLPIWAIDKKGAEPSPEVKEWFDKASGTNKYLDQDKNPRTYSKQLANGKEVSLQISNRIENLFDIVKGITELYMFGEDKGYCKKATIKHKNYSTLEYCQPFFNDPNFRGFMPQELLSQYFQLNSNRYNIIIRFGTTTPGTFGWDFINQQGQYEAYLCFYERLKDAGYDKVLKQVETLRLQPPLFTETLSPSYKILKGKTGNIVQVKDTSSTSYETPLSAPSYKIRFSPVAEYVGINNLNEPPQSNTTPSIPTSLLDQLKQQQNNSHIQSPNKMQEELHFAYLSDLDGSISIGCNDSKKLDNFREKLIEYQSVTGKLAAFERTLLTIKVKFEKEVSEPLKILEAIEQEILKEQQKPHTGMGGL